MANGVGSILREARNRRKVDLSEVEAATRIRARFLRAIENEEWDVLPGGVYTRGFIRAYASHLGLDGERLAEDFRREVEGAAEHGPRAELAPVASSPAAAARSGGRSPGPWVGLAAIVTVVLLAALVIVALPGGGGGGGVTARHPHRSKAGGAEQRSPTVQAQGSGVSVRLAAGAEVWVCMLDAKGRRLVDGQILEAGAKEGPFHSGSFTVSFGNGEVTMLIDGRQAEIPATSSPIGYSIDASGALTQLSESERPTCT